MLQSLPDICEVHEICGPGAQPEAAPDLFIELPHGATEMQHLQELKPRVSQYPGPRHDLFFTANTDQGSFEYAQAMARLITESKHWQGEAAERAARMKVVMVRALLPRTIIDVNRIWADDAEAESAGLTRGVPDFITDTDDLAFLKQTYDRYQEIAEQGYAQIAATGGFALNLHTYAPISVNIVAGEYIVDTLERAYSPDHYDSYPKRPEVQLITRTPAGEYLSHAELCGQIQKHLEEGGFEVFENDPFNLHTSTTAYRHAARYPGKTLTLEVRRDLLVPAFDPFSIMPMNQAGVDRVAHCLARAMMAHFLGENP